MKGKFNIFLILLSIIVFPTVTMAQYCNNFHESFCTFSENELYKPNGQSKSALFSKGQTSELSVIVYKGQDYRISLCMDENLGSQIAFKVYETQKVQVEKVVEKKEKEDIYDADGNPTGDQKDVITKETRMVQETQKELLYDNSTDNYATELEFSVETTRRLILEITIPDSGGTGKSKGKLVKSSEMGCVGILLEFMTTAKQGFYGTGF